jgi:hypothetical protein
MASLNNMGNNPHPVVGFIANDLRREVTLFFTRQCGGDPELVRMQFHHIRTGLECMGLARVRTKFLNRRQQSCRMSFAIKHIGADNMRELSAYRLLAIKYHLSVLSSPYPAAKRSQSTSALQGWMRIIRQVDAITRN